MKKHAPIMIKYLLQSRFKPKVVKTTYTERKNADWILIIDKMLFFFSNPNVIKIN